jgi:phage shock protein PspC (stress-responsive transcriptional regulator)/sulfur carrier protein ThiS
MNEVTKIHLGRQPLNISVAAHKALRAYIDAITKQVGDDDVVEEVELRMAELLAENGITGDKVVLVKDVDYLKKQLGDPQDFKETDDVPVPAAQSSAAKRLFRDADNAMVAGVATGLSNYFGVDVLLIRVLFVIGTIAWGGGILLYIVLWLLVPEAKSSSEKLQMAGKPVTVDSLKEVVERADVKGAAKRANATIAPVINSIFRIILKIIGLGFVLGGLAVIFGLIVVRIYMAAHHGQLFEENLFPVGTTEHILADLGLISVGIIALFAILSGVAMFKRRWPTRGWITGVLAGLFLVVLAGTIALAAGAAPKVRDRYLSRSHTQTRSVQPFQDIVIQGKDVDYQWEYADTYSVSFHYFDNPDISKIKTTVSDNLLTIDTSNYTRDQKCEMLCLFRAYNLLVTVKGPQPLSIPSPADESTHLIPQPYKN